MTIVGVVGDIRTAALSAGTPEIYMPYNSTRARRPR